MLVKNEREKRTLLTGSEHGGDVVGLQGSVLAAGTPTIVVSLVQELNQIGTGTGLIWLSSKFLDRPSINLILINCDSDNRTC